MLVNIAYIPKEYVEEAQKSAAILAKAVEDGMMELVDTEVARLRKLGADGVYVSEEVWREFLKKLRKAKGTFVASYLLDREQQEAILQLEWEDLMDVIVDVVVKAYDTSGLVLELPIMEDRNEEF